MFEEIFTHSERETEHAATRFAAALPPRAMLFLEGDLGAGKSVFARAIIRALSNDPDLTVPSPTFTLLQHYDTPRGPVWHYDLYRLKDPDEIFELSWDDALASGIVLVEWPERLGHHRPGGMTVTLDTVPTQPSQRLIRIARP